MMPEGGDSRVPLSVVVFTADAERLHYALVLASTAAALGRPARLFFAGPGVRALIAGAGATAGPMAAAALNGRGVATLDELFAACCDLGVDMMACEMALRVHDVGVDAFRGDLKIVVAGAATLLDADGGSVLFVS